MFLTSLSQWNSFYCSDKKYPYLTYDIKIECKNLNPVKLSKKQLHLYKKICELKDKGLTYKQISDKLNKLGIPPTRGKVGEFTPQRYGQIIQRLRRT